MLQQRLAPLRIGGLHRLSGGASSLTYGGTLGAGEPVVVKVAPAGVPPERNRDVLRQARVMRALTGTGVPVPAVLWEDAGDPPAAPPLFVMAHVPGTSLEPLFDVRRIGDDAPASVAARLHRAAGVMASLHALDVGALGLAGEPVVGPLDEVARWERAFRTVDGALVPGWAEAAAVLRASAPAPLGPTLVHGDFRLGNMLAVGAEVTAVIDWEIWTVGDPRVDLGWFLVNADPATYRRPTRYAGLLPSPAELAAAYGDVPDVAWFEALACFKSAATWSLIVKHDRRRPVPDPELQAMAAVLPRLVRRAARLLV